MKKYNWIPILLLIVCLPLIMAMNDSPPKNLPYLGLANQSSFGPLADGLRIQSNASNQFVIIDADNNTYTVYCSDPNIAMSISDNSVDSGAYVDRSIDTEHLAFDIIDPNHLADADWTDFSISSGAATLDNDVVGADELADGDYGDAVISSGAITVDPNADIEANSFIATSGVYADANSTYGITSAGVATVSSLGVAATANPAWTFLDSDAAADANTAFIKANLINTVDTTETSYMRLQVKRGGSDVTALELDGNTAMIDIGSFELTTASNTRRISEIVCETFTIAEPDEMDGIEDEVVLKHYMTEHYPNGFTVVSFAFTASASVTDDDHNLEHWDDRAGSTKTTIDDSAAFSNSQRVEDDGTLSSATIPADGYLVIDLDDTSDDVGTLEITVCGFVVP